MAFATITAPLIYERIMASLAPIGRGDDEAAQASGAKKLCDARRRRYTAIIILPATAKPRHFVSFPLTPVTSASFAQHLAEHAECQERESRAEQHESRATDSMSEAC